MQTPEPALSPDDASVPTAHLRAACQRGSSCTVGYDIVGGRASRRAQLSAVDEGEVHLTLTHTTDDLAAIEKLAATDDAGLTITVRMERDEIVFFARVLRFVIKPAGEREDAALEISASLPAEVITTRRRQSFRIAVAAQDEIALKLARLESHAILRDKPAASRYLRCTICDLSALGMRAVVWAGRVQALRLVEGQRFRIELACAEGDMVLDARLRHPWATARDDAFAFCGFEFVFDDKTIESRRNRQRLDAILARLQRDAVRRQSAA